MTVMAMAGPVPSGKIEALETDIAEATRHEDFNRILTGFGIEHESWHIEKTLGPPPRMTINWL